MSEDKAIHTLYERIGHLFCEQPYGELGRYLTYYAEDRLYLVFDLWYHGFFLVEAKSPKDAIEKVNCDKLTYLPKGATMSDNISRADAIERIANDNVVGGMKRINEYRDSTEHNDYLDGISTAIATVDDLLSAEAEWIPCSERLPEKDELVLVTVWNDVTIAWRNIYGGWESAEDMYEKGDVTAWMPLPKPYREDGEE